MASESGASRAFAAITVSDIARVAMAPMGDLDAAEIAAWAYPGIYAFYDFASDPGDLVELLDAERRAGHWFSARIADHGLVGFAELKPAADGTVELGLGLRPECTGRGLGQAFVTHLCDWVTEHARPAGITLRVADFNARAIAVYQRAGFAVTGSAAADVYGRPVRFVHMRLDRPPGLGPDPAVA
jgi:[ribosomal protein S18]-alanine N-acetyltransferase